MPRHQSSSRSFYQTHHSARISNSKWKNKTVTQITSFLVRHLISKVTGREFVSDIDHRKKFMLEINEADWRYDVYQYLHYEIFPTNGKQSKKPREELCAILLDKVLHKMSFSRPLLKCWEMKMWFMFYERFTKAVVETTWTT